jgi:protein arginine kinase
VSSAFLPAFPSWLTGAAAMRSPVLSTRIRLARNLADGHFPLTADGPGLEGVLDRVAHWVKRRTAFSLRFARLRDLDELQRGQLAERGLVHMDSASQPAHVGLALGAGPVSLLVNEEDHLRLQVMVAGLNLTRGLALARRVDAQLGQDLPLAVHPQFGFLTACPTNVGTGLRASVMLHLPALTLTRGIIQVLQAVLHMGLAVRGIYGEGTELRSVFFQVSNQVTLGRTEDEIIAHLEGVTRQIMDREAEARRQLVKDRRAVLEDKVGRALGVLAGARLLGLEEALDLLSTLRLGVETGVVAGLELTTLNELLLRVQPAHLQALHKQGLTAEEQAIRRAELVKRRLRFTASARGPKLRSVTPR